MRQALRPPTPQPATGAGLGALVLRVTGPGLSSGRTILLDRPSLTIGRASTCDVVLADHDRLLSARHGRIELDGGEVWFTDSSTNGTYLNNDSRPLPRDVRQLLHVGDRLQLGNVVLSLEVAPAVTRPSFAAPDALADDGPSGLAGFFDAPAPAPARPRPETLRPQAMNVAAPVPGSTDPFAHLDSFLSELKDGETSRSPATPPLPEFSTQAAPAPAPPAAAPAPEHDEPFFANPEREPAPVSPPVQASAGDPEASLMGIIAQEIRGDDPAARPMNWKGGHELEASGADPAMVALASFWCGLGVIPGKLDIHALAEMMGEFGAVLRLCADRLASRLPAVKQADLASSNPWAGGSGGLRSYVNGGRPHGRPLDEAMAELLAETDGRIAQPQALAALHAALDLLRPESLERHFDPLVRRRHFGARQRELWLLFEHMQGPLMEMAELRFRQELAGEARTSEPGAGARS